MSQNNYLSKREVYWYSKAWFLHVLCLKITTSQRERFIHLSHNDLDGYGGLKITTSQRERFIQLHCGRQQWQLSLKITTSQRERFIKTVKGN